VSLIATLYIRPELLNNYKMVPVGFAIPVLVFGSLAAMLWNHRSEREKSAFIASCLYLAGMLGGAAFAVYPNVLPASTGEQYSLTIYNTITGSYAMHVAFVWWIFGIVIAIGYFVFLFKMFKGKVSEAGGYGH